VRVEQFLIQSARRLPAKTALVCDGRRLTFAELDEQSSKLACALTQRGLGRGDRVVLFLDNCVEAAVSIFAVLKAGGVFTPINPSTKAEKLAYIMGNCRARAVVTQPRLAGVVSAALSTASDATVAIVTAGATSGGGTYERWDDVLRNAPPAPLPAPGIDLDLAMLIYTSGSTGVPKGVMMTHQNVWAAATSITTYLENTADDVILNVLPMSFDYGLYQLLMSVKVGGTLVLMKSFAYPQVVLREAAAEMATGLPLVPTMAALLLQQRNLAPGALPHLRYITNTAAALPPAHIERLQALFPHAQVYSMYGLTECKRCTWLPPAELARRPSSVGIAIPGTEAYVVDEAGNKAEPGVVGELVIRGAHVMKGYWEDQAATDRALRPGPYPWEKVLYTGDLFSADEDGFLYFVGRKDDIIKSRGEKVSPREVENVIHALSGVAECAVVGVPDPVLGSAIRAVVVLADGAALGGEDVIRHCARHLEEYMVPKAVRFVETLPKSDNGKVDRRRVQAEVAEVVAAAEKPV
jgi:amino acid adenylation domain-containing protein